MSELELPLPISANVYWRHTVGRNGKPFVYVSQEAVVYREQVGWLCVAAGVGPYHGPLRVTILAYICDSRRDTDNVVKVLFDAMQGHAYDDDNQIVEYHVYRHKARTRKDSKVIVKIEEAA